MHQKIDQSPSTHVSVERNDLLESATQARFARAISSAADPDCANKVVVIKPTFSGVLAVAAVPSRDDLQGFVVGFEFDTASGTYSLRSNAQLSSFYQVAVTNPNNRGWWEQDKLAGLDWLLDNVQPGRGVRVGIAGGGDRDYSYTLVLPDPRVPGSSTVPVIRDDWRENAALVNGIFQSSKIIVGTNPPAGTSGFVTGAIGAESSHISLQLEEGRVRALDLGSKNGFFVRRAILGGDVTEYFSSNRSTLLLPNDRVWLGSSPELGLPCDLMIPSFIGAHRHIPKTTLGVCFTESSAVAFLLRNILREPEIGVSCSFRSNYRVNLVGPHIDIAGKIVSHNPALGLFNFQFTSTTLNNAQVTGPLREAPVSVWGREVALLPGDRLENRPITGSTRERRPYVIVPENERYDELQEQLRQAEMRRVEAKTLWIDEFKQRMNGLLGEVIKGELARFVIHRKLEDHRKDAIGIEIDGLVLTTVARLTFSADDNGTYRVSTAVPSKFTGMAVRFRSANGALMPEQTFERDTPMRLAPGDVIVLPTKDHGRIEYEMPANSIFQRKLESRVSQSTAAPIIASFVGTIGSMGSVINPGEAPLERDYLRTAGLYPVTTIKQPEHSASWQLSQPFVMDSGGRIGVIAIVDVEGKRSVRVYYTSNSHAIFRLLPAVNSAGLIHLPGYDKGGNELGLAPTWDIQKGMWQHVIKCFHGNSLSGTDASKWRNLSETPEVWQGVVRLNGNFDEYESYGDADEANPARACREQKILHGGKGDDSKVLRSTRIARDHEPIFGVCLDHFEVPKLPFGPSAVYNGPLRFFLYSNEAGTDEHVVTVTPAGQFMPMIGKSPKAPDFQLSPFGLPNEFYGAGPLVLPLYERPSQISDNEIGFGENVPGHPEYWNINKLLGGHPLLSTWLATSIEATYSRR